MAARSDPHLERHLTAWLGAWPPDGGAVHVVGSRRRSEPGWDGRVHPLVGVVTPFGAVLSVPPDRVDPVRHAVGDRTSQELGTAHGQVAAAVGASRSRLIDGVFRWSTTPTPLPDVGVWVAAEDPVVPEWLAVFGGQALLALDDGVYVAGVGLKRHDPTGEEIAVGTEEAARGRGLARRLVAQAARTVVERAGVATYLHAPSNLASAHVAEAAGFPDLGWRVLALVPA